MAKDQVRPIRGFALYSFSPSTNFTARAYYPVLALGKDTTSSNVLFLVINDLGALVWIEEGGATTFKAVPETGRHYEARG